MKVCGGVRGRRAVAGVVMSMLVAGVMLVIGQPAGAAGAPQVAGAGRWAAAAVPGAPTLDQLVPGDTSIRVNWSFGNPNLGVTGYTATASPGGAHCDAPGRFSTQCTIPGLTNGVSYAVRVVAHHLSDGDSAPSNQLSATPNRSVELTTVVADGRSVSVNWDLVSIVEPHEFVVTIGSDPPRECQSGGSGRTCEVEVVPYGTHPVTVTAIYPDPSRNLVSAPRDVVVAAPPKTVTVTGVAVSGHDAAISWTYGEFADRYDAILRTEPPRTCTSALTTGLAANGSPPKTCTIEDLPYGTYQVQVDAYLDGLEATSELFTFTVAPPAPATPHNVTATAGVSSIVASWSAPTDSEAAITGYRATASPGPASCTTTGATSCLIGGAAGQPYTVTVVALGADGGESSPSAPSNPATPTLPVVSETPPDTDLALTTDQGQITTAEPGQDIVFVGTGFAAYSTVVITVYSSHQVLATVEANANGNFSRLVTMPADLSTGWHTVVALGIAPDGSIRAMAIDIRIAGRPILGLPATGANVAGALLLGACLTGAGAALYTLTRRRRRRIRFAA